jgi:hypothetical protein
LLDAARVGFVDSTGTIQPAFAGFFHPKPHKAAPLVTHRSPIDHILFLESELYFKRNFKRSRLSVLGFQYRITRTN